MPRVYAPRRTHVGYREDGATLLMIDALAKEQGVERSDVLRAATHAYVTAALQGETDAGPARRAAG